MIEKSIYKTPKGKKVILELYDKQLKSIKENIKEKMVSTRYGDTHVTHIGNKESIPLICLHGGNMIGSDLIKAELAFLQKFNSFVLDTIGHPGKSAETRLSVRDLSYGYWLLDVLDGLNLIKVNIYTGSFGAGIAIRLATIAPERITSLFIVSPSGIANGSIRDKMILMIPYIRYRIKSSEKNLIRLCSTMIARLDEERIEILTAIFKYVHLASEMPRPAPKEELKNFNAPTIIYAANNDILFPASKVIPRAKEIFPNLVDTHIFQEGIHEQSIEEHELIHQKAGDFFFSNDI